MHCGDKEPPLDLRIYLLLIVFCWARSLPLREVCFPSESPLDQTKFLFARGYQWEIPSGLGVGEWVHFFRLKGPNRCKPMQAKPRF